MENGNARPHPSDVRVKLLEIDDSVEVMTCCHELAGMIDGLEEDIKNGRVSGLLAYKGETCIGALLARLDMDTSFKEKIPLPCLRILFIEINKYFRGQGFGTLLLDRFIRDQREREDIGSITVHLFKNYSEGALFFEKFGFAREKPDRKLIRLKMNLWVDYGVVDIDDEEIT